MNGKLVCLVAVERGRLSATWPDRPERLHISYTWRGIRWCRCANCVFCV